MARVRLRLLLLAAVFVGFLPGAAFAHGGDNHQRAVGAHGGAGSLMAERHAWTPICPPGSGHVCACDNLSLSDGATNPPLAPRRAASIHRPIRIAAPASPPAAQSQPSPQFPPGLPRAPPLA